MAPGRLTFHFDLYDKNSLILALFSLEHNIFQTYVSITGFNVSQHIMLTYVKVTKNDGTDPKPNPKL